MKKVLPVKLLSYSPFGTSYLPISYFQGLIKDKVADTDTVLYRPQILPIELVAESYGFALPGFNFGKLLIPLPI